MARLKGMCALYPPLDLSLLSPCTGIDFEDCYKEYLPAYTTAKVANNLDPISPIQTFHHPAVTFQSATTKTTAAVGATEPERLPGPARRQAEVHMTTSSSGLPQVPSMYSKPQSQHGFNNALDLANMPQTRMGGSSANNQSYIDFPSSLTQPEHYHTAFPSEFGFGPSMQQFGYSSIPLHPMPPHPTTIGGLAPISVLIPPLVNTGSTNPSGIAAGDSFTDFFPALLTENPLNGNSQEGMASESGKKSVGDLFNLTAGLDDFEDPPILERNVNQEIGGVDTKNDGSIESSWNRPLIASNKNNDANSSSLQANEEGSPFVHSSKEANQTIVSEDSVNSPSRHPLGRMDSFGFTTSLNSEVPGFDASVNMQKSAPTSNNNPNWPNFDQVPNAQSSLQTQAFINAKGDDNNSNGKLNVNTESVIPSKSAKVKGDQKVDTAKASPKGKKKKKKGTKSSSNEASSRSGNETVRNTHFSVRAPESGNVTNEDLTSEASVALTEELVGIEEQKPRSVINYSLSSSSTPTLVGLSSVTGFRSEGHTPPIPTTSEITVGMSATTTTTTFLQPFSDVVTSNENSILPEISDLHGSSKPENRPPLERGIDDIFDSKIHDVSELAATFGRVEGRSSLLSSIMAARAKNKESDTSMAIDVADDVSAFKSSAKFPVFGRIKDIEDDSSQESHDNDEAKELTAAPMEGGKAVQQHVDGTVIPTKEVIETVDTEIQQPTGTPPDQSELVAPDTTIQPAKLDKEPAKPENPILENKKAIMSEEGGPVREECNITDSQTAVPTSSTGMILVCVYCMIERYCYDN